MARRGGRRLLTVLFVAGAVLLGGVAQAQQPPSPYPRGHYAPKHHAPPGHYPPHGHYPPPYVPPPPPPAQGPPRVVYDWDPDQPVPEGYQLDSDRNGKLFGAGIGLFVSAYTLSALVGTALVSNPESDGDGTSLFIPLVGPFIATATLDPGGGGKGLLISNGVFQIAGALALGLSFADRHYKLFRTSRVKLTPVVGARVGGISAEVSF